MAGEILQGFQVGMNAALRIQELQSQRAAQAARERALVQEMSLQMEQRNTLIQYRADMAKAFGATKMQTSETVPVFGPSGVVGTVKNPKPMSPEDATFQNIIPVIAKYEPEKVPAALQALATARYRQQSSDALTQQRQSSTAVNEARVKEIEARVTQINKGKTGVDPEWVRNINFMEQRRGKPFTPEELDTMFRIHSGQEGRAAVERAPISRADYIAKNLPSARIAERQGLTINPRPDAVLMKELSAQWEELYGGEAQQAAPAPPPEVPGRKVIQNGVTYEFDGKKWNAVK